MDLDGIYCRLSYGRGRAVAPLVEASSSDFLCPYRSHCFALCHCCDFDACDCQMICPANCTCYHDQSWSTNVVDCSVNALQDIPNSIPVRRSTYSFAHCLSYRKEKSEAVFCRRWISRLYNKRFFVLDKIRSLFLLCHLKKGFTTLLLIH